MPDFPELAISVRQPWAWALIHAGKTHENRSAGALKWMVPLTGRRAIHASKGMTREKYEEARDFMASELGIVCPAPADLKRGGIIGSVMITGVVNRSESPWFFGPRGLVIEDPQPCDFIPSAGALGYFKWKPADASIVPPPARWMLPATDRLPQGLQFDMIWPDPRADCPTCKGNPYWGKTLSSWERCACVKKAVQ